MGTTGAGLTCSAIKDGMMMIMMMMMMMALMMMMTWMTM